MLNKIANRAFKACADWLNRFYSPRESKGYKVESQNDNYVCLETLFEPDWEQSSSKSKKQSNS